ncbi:MAG: hypothetical protein ACXABY_31960 [Candidatus Thorarchaeota archaeon]|jgi:uncharacterized protein (DUF488 family)
MMAEKVIYTAGYGNNSPEVFLGRLKAAGIDYVFDVRRQWSKSWCAAYHQGKKIQKTIEGSGMWYREWYALSNRYDRLDAYLEWLDSSGLRYIEDLAGRGAIWQSGSKICFLCAEGDPYEKDGVTPRCHRVYVAEALVKQLGDGWSVVHL